MVSLVKKYLEINHFSNQKEAFEDLFQSHPNYPSVFAITDTLDMLSIENVAIKVPKEQLIELPESFLAVFKGDLSLVSKSTSSIKIKTQKGENNFLSFEEFLADWNGIIIAIEPNGTVVNTDSKINTKWLIFSLPLFLLIGLSIFYNEYRLSDLIFLGSSIIGVVISVFIVQEKIGINNQIISKFCNINPNASCDSVIKSNKGEINRWLSFSDLPLIFFGTSVWSILLGPYNSIVLIGYLCLLSIPFIVYSIWIQKVEIKKWCMLCLAISFLIFIQAIVWYFTDQFTLNFTFSNFFPFVFLLILTSSIWFGVKPILENMIKAESSLKELTKFKRNFSLLDFLSKKIEVVDGFSKLQGINFGNKEAAVKLTIIISPSCGHCHKAFEESFELVSKFPEKIFLNVLFNVNPENNDNPYKVVVERLMAINYAKPEKIAEAISDWHIHKIGLEAWNLKWKIDAISMKVHQQIQQQYNWCLENEFNFTPVKIVNGKLFPNEYEITELKYFINDFSEAKELAETNSLVEV